MYIWEGVMWNMIPNSLSHYLSCLSSEEIDELSDWLQNFHEEVVDQMWQELYATSFPFKNPDGN
jgi:hypothetical protein